VPNAQDRYVQFIDVRDLAGWLISAGLRGLTGIYNAVGSEYELSTVLLAAARVAGHTGELIAAEDDWLTAHRVNYWAGPRSLPLWLPRSDSAFARRSRSRFVAAGGTERTLQDTLEDVLADERARGLDRERRSGLTQQEQRVLLTESRSRRLIRFLPEPRASLICVRRSTGRLRSKLLSAIPGASSIVPR